MTKHGYLVVTAILVALASGGAALAASSDVGDQARPLAEGHAFVLGLGEQQPGADALFSIDARSLPAPAGHASAKGAMFFETTNPETLFYANVTCVQVSGNDGIVTAVLRVPTSRVGEHIVAEAVDGDATGSQDLLRFSFESNGGVFPSAIPGCWEPVFAPVPIAKGFVEPVAAHASASRR